MKWVKVVHQSLTTSLKEHASAAPGNIRLAGGGAGNQVFEADDELVLGIDRTRESLLRPVAVDAENGAEFNLIADDQYSIRQNKIGYFGSLRRRSCCC